MLNKLGQGAMGAVYLARQVSLDRQIALKILPPDLATDQEFLERFRREARAAARLNNPHIVMAYDVGVASGYHYIAMEYVDGKDLEQGLAEQPTGRYSPEEVYKIARHMALALEAANASGIVHRDMKPANILKHSDGTYKLTDLGLAHRAVDDGRVTQAGSAVGTPYYISPEQARGDVKVDIRSDIYSLGASMYHLATGKLPFPGDNTVVVMTRHLTEQVGPPDQVEPSVPKALSRLILKMMAKDPKDRHQSPKEVLEDIELAERGEVPLLKRARAKARSSVTEQPRAERDEKPSPQALRSRATLHPRMSRMASRRPLKKTGALGAVERLPKQVQQLIWWGLFLLVAVVVGVALARFLGPVRHVRVERPAMPKEPEATPAPAPETTPASGPAPLIAPTQAPVLPIPAPEPPKVSDQAAAWLANRGMPMPLVAWQFTGKSIKAPSGGTLVESADERDLKLAKDSKESMATKYGMRFQDGSRLVSELWGRKLAEAIRKTGAFSLETEVHCADTRHTGPARIVSLSWDGHYRNFTLGQEKDQWVVRLRTTFTGNNGTNPEARIPGLDTQRNHVLVTYSGESLRFYLNGKERPIEGKKIAGSLSNWDVGYPLVLGNEYRDTRNWAGVIRFVAFYDRALTPEQARTAAASTFPE